MIIGGNADSIFQRLMRAAGRDDLADDARLRDNAGRVEHQEEVDGAISRWTATLDSGEVLERLAEASVPSGPIYSVEDIMRDPQVNQRGMFEAGQGDGDPLKIPALVPRLEDTPGETLWPGPALGEHNEEILGDLGLSHADIERLATDGVI